MYYTFTIHIHYTIHYYTYTFTAYTVHLLYKLAESHVMPGTKFWTAG